MMSKNKRTRSKERHCGWFERFQTAMSAAAFAEANMHGYAREILESGTNRDSKVLLVLDGPVLEERPLKYALTLCRNTGASLSLLRVVNGDQGNPSLDEELEPSLFQMLKSSGVRYTVESVNGSLQKELSRFLKSCKGVISVVMRSPDPGSQSRANLKKINRWQGLNCPVVLI